MSTVIQIGRLEMEHDHTEKFVYFSDRSGKILAKFPEDDAIKIAKFIRDNLDKK